MLPFIVFVAGAFLFFIVLVIWVIARLAKLSGISTKVDQFDRELDRLRTRLTLLETRPTTDTVQTPAAAAPEPASVHLPDLDVPVAAPYRPAYVRAPLPTQPLVQPQPIPPMPIPSVTLASTIPPPASAPTFRTVPPQAEDVRPNPVPETAINRTVTLEERLGENWLNKLGIVTLVTGLVLLLGYQLRTLGPVGKSVMGVVLSGIILATGLVLERRERYRKFARAAIGGGWALLYFVTFALFHIPAMQVLHSQATDLILMLTVATAMVLHSLKYRSQVVTSLAFLLAVFTVSISQVTIFSLVAGAILAVGLVIVAFKERWFVLALGGLVAVYLNHFLWLHRVLPNGLLPGHPFPEFLSSAALLLFYWLLFRVFYIFRVPETDTDRVSSTLNCLLNSAGLLTLLKYQSSHPEWAFRGLLALGVAELALAFVARRRHHNAFIALTCIGSLFLLAAVPFHYAGSSWSLLWLLQSEMLFVAGLAIRETVFRRLGVVTAFAAIAHMLIAGAAPVFNLRQLAPDANHHLTLALTFACAALAAWFNGEYAQRRWPSLFDQPLDRSALRVLSYTAALCAAVAAWLTFAGPWTLLPWLAIALGLAFASSRLSSHDLAQQADVLALAAIIRAALINFTQWDHFANTPRTLILLAACALLYAQMRRRQPSWLLSQEAAEASSAWAAAALLATLAWYALQPAAVAIAWCVLGMVLLETGLATRKSFFRQQGLVLLAASFVRLFFINVALASAPRLYTMLPLAAIYAYIYQRLYSSDQPSRTERIAGAINAWFALATMATLLYFSLRPEWVSIGGAVLAISALLLARVFQRRLFTAQAITLILITAARTLAFNVLSTEPLSVPFTQGRVFTVILTCALLLAALPIAFSIRRQQPSVEENKPAWLALILHHPEQVLFFAPLVILFALVPIQLRAGMITIGWSALGLLTFLFALTVGERSFRLAGLTVLLVGLGKIVTVDIWHASPTDRYITLIVMGGALLLVSFLYSRYRETILELL